MVLSVLRTLGKGTKGRYNGIGTNGNGRFKTHQTARGGPTGVVTRVHVGANMAEKGVAIRTFGMPDENHFYRRFHALFDKKISKELASLPPKLLKVAPSCRVSRHCRR